MQIKKNSPRKKLAKRLLAGAMIGLVLCAIQFFTNISLGTSSAFYNTRYMLFLAIPLGILICCWLIECFTYRLATKEVESVVENGNIHVICDYCCMEYSIFILIALGVAGIAGFFLFNPVTSMASGVKAGLGILLVMHLSIAFVYFRLMTSKLFILTDDTVWVRGFNRKWRSFSVCDLEKTFTGGSSKSRVRYYCFPTGNFSIGFAARGAEVFHAEMTKICV